MFQPTRISEQLLFSTVRIEASIRTGGSSIGTAFFFWFDLGNGRTLPLLITNKHVTRDTVVGRFYLHEAQTPTADSPSGRSFDVTLTNFEQRWFHHPDPNVDLCAMLVTPVFMAAQQQGKFIFHRHLDTKVIPDSATLADLSALQSVAMIGYPIGLWDEVNNLPLLRRGVTATHPSVDFKGMPVSVVDIAVFPGSSGSPVVVVDEGSYNDKTGNLVLGNRLLLLGVQYAGPTYDVHGKIVAKEIPTIMTPVAQTQLMIHLGYMIKAREILVLCNALRAHLKAAGDTTVG